VFSACGNGTRGGHIGRLAEQITKEDLEAGAGGRRVFRDMYLDSKSGENKILR
jgi:hypothetical protein